MKDKIYMGLVGVALFAGSLSAVNAAAAEDKVKTQDVSAIVRTHIQKFDAEVTGEILKSGMPFYDFLNGRRKQLQIDLEKIGVVFHPWGCPVQKISLDLSKEDETYLMGLLLGTSAVYEDEVMLHTHLKNTLSEGERNALIEEGGEARAAESERTDYYHRAAWLISGAKDRH